MYSFSKVVLPCIKLINLTFFVPFTKNGIFKLTKCGLMD